MMEPKTDYMGETYEACSIKEVPLPPKALADYRAIVGDDVIAEILDLAADLKGVRVLQLNSSAAGGGVAELLTSTMPLMKDCGLEVHWQVLCKHLDFFGVTKVFHNALQGMKVTVNETDLALYLAQNELASKQVTRGFDVIIVHDPQPAAIRYFTGNLRAKWVWRCHIDTSHPRRTVWRFLKPFVAQYDAAVFTLPQFLPPDLIGPEPIFIAPAIDPLTKKNHPLPDHQCRREVAGFGLDLTRPIILQVSRFDPWKDPIGVIQAYKMVKREMPDVQLALVGAIADDDPEGWEIYASVVEEARKDTDLHVLSNLSGVGSFQVNAFQRVADVVVQKSLREGFGLVVSEALWKSRPMVAGDTGGIPLQIEDGVTGLLTDSAADCANKLLYLLNNPLQAKSMAEKGRERVRQNFLITRLLRDELRLIRDLVRR